MSLTNARARSLFLLYLATTRLSPDRMLVAGTPLDGLLVCPGGIVGITAYAHLPATCDLSSITFEEADTIGRNSALPAPNSAIACAFFQPTDAGSTTLSVASQPRYVW